MRFALEIARTLATAGAVLALGACTDAALPTGPGNGAPLPPPPAPAPAPDVHVAPAAPTVLSGQVVRFAAFVRAAPGDSLPLPVQWTTTGGSITGDGEFVATQPGTYSVVATDPEQQRADTALVTVRAPLTTAPGETNLPAGFTLLTSRRFDAKIEDGWTDRGDANFSIVQKADAPLSGGNVGQARFAEGFPSGSGPISTTYYMTGRKKLYVDFTLQLSSNWDGNDAGVNKIFFIWMHGDPSICVSATGTGANPLVPQIRVQNTPMGSENLSPNLDSSIKIVRGKWQRWEIVLVANTPGRADGEVHWWVDGVKIGEHKGLTFAGAGQTNTWDRLSWNPTYGGAGAPVPHDQYMWMDHVTIAAP